MKQCRQPEGMWIESRNDGLNMERLELIAPCHFGLEAVLKREILELGYEIIRVEDGRILFEGDAEAVCRANIYLRTAERILIKAGEFHAETFEELFQGVKALPLENFIGEKDRFPVKGWSINSKLTSVPDCQSIVKKAAVERLKEKYGISWFEETGELFQLQFSILKNEVTVMLDSSGVGLHKRGYRKTAMEAPIKETLAAGIVDLARIKPDSVLLDPFCGSGTFLIEGATKAMNIAPGINRRFVSENWQSIPQSVWREERQRCFDLIRRDASFTAYGSDIDPESILLSEHNAKKAGVSSRIKFKRADVADFESSVQNGTLICNPPYGERLLDIKQAEEIYKTMGKQFLPSMLNYYIITPHDQFEKLFGRPATKRRKLYNGMIKCQLYMYFK